MRAFLLSARRASCFQSCARPAIRTLAAIPAPTQGKHRTLGSHPFNNCNSLAVIDSRSESFILPEDMATIEIRAPIQGGAEIFC